MVILRADIERALDEIISQEEGMRFQGLAVVLGKKRWPELIARQRKKDFGLDAYAPASLTGNVGRGLAASTTPKLSKVMGDAKTGKKNFPDLQMLLFVTPSKVGNADRRAWEVSIREECGLELYLIEREEIITQMLLPENAALCGSFLSVAVDMEPDVGNLVDKARRAAAIVTHAWAGSNVIDSAVAAPGKAHACRQAHSSVTQIQAIHTGSHGVTSAAPLAASGTCSTSSSIRQAK